MRGRVLARDVVGEHYPAELPLFDAVGERVSTAWAARRARRSDLPEASDLAEATVDSGPTSAAFDAGGITVVVTVHLSALGADSTTAREVAEHVVEKLFLPAEQLR